MHSTGQARTDEGADGKMSGGELTGNIPAWAKAGSRPWWWKQLACHITFPLRYLPHHSHCISPGLGGHWSQIDEVQLQDAVFGQHQSVGVHTIEHLSVGKFRRAPAPGGDGTDTLKSQRIGR